MFCCNLILELKTKEHARNNVQWLTERAENTFIKMASVKSKHEEDKKISGTIYDLLIKINLMKFIKKNTHLASSGVYKHNN